MHLTTPGILVLLLSTVSLPAFADPADPVRTAIDRTWGAVTRAQHFTGTWSITLDDGRRLSGDWAVADDTESANRWTTRRWLHLVSSSSADYCAIAVTENRLYCATATTEMQDLNLPEHAGDRMTLAVPVHRYACHGNCVPQRAGAIATALKPARPTLAKSQMALARIHRTDLAGRLRGMLTSATTRATAPKVVLDVTYAVRGEARDSRDARSVTRDQWEAHAFDREVIEYAASVTIGPSPTQIEIEPREVGRFVEACTRGGYHGSCSAPQEICTRKAR